jgi:hypothetical protein
MDCGGAAAGFYTIPSGVGITFGFLGYRSVTCSAGRGKPMFFHQPAIQATWPRFSFATNPFSFDLMPGAVLFCSIGKFTPSSPNSPSTGPFEIPLRN